MRKAITIVAFIIITGCESHTSTGQAEFMLRGYSSPVVPPVRFINSGIFTDGGTLLFDFEDSKGDKFVFCCDGSFSSETPSAIYVCAEHPTRSGAQLLPEGSTEEKALFQLMQGWIDKHERKIKRFDARSCDQPHRHPVMIAIRLKDVLDVRNNVLKIRAWLNEYYTREQQEELLARGTPEGLQDQDETAWHKVQCLHGYKNDQRHRQHTTTADGDE